MPLISSALIRLGRALKQGKHRRDQSLRELTSHLTQAYLPCERTWILLFPEGGFLHKRREVSTKFAMKNNLPVLQHTTIPRVGAVQNIVATIGPEKNKLLSNGNADVSSTRSCCSHVFPRLTALFPADNNPADKCLKWIIDLTVAYPNGKPLDITNIFFASAPPCNTVFHYRCYPVSEVCSCSNQTVPSRTILSQLPTDNEELKQWVYDRYIEKDAMLAKYYETGKFPDHRRPGEFCQPRLVLHDGTRMALLHLLYITSTLFHCCLLKTLFSYAVSFL